MLNYAYGVLMAQTQVQLIGDGYDPTIGILHGRENERGTYAAFALDQMEPMRPVVDRAILELVKSATFVGGDFSIQADGVCRLNPELARRVAQSALGHCAASKVGATTNTYKRGSTGSLSNARTPKTHS